MVEAKWNNNKIRAAAVVFIHDNAEFSITNNNNTIQLGRGCATYTYIIMLNISKLSLLIPA